GLARACRDPRTADGVLHAMQLLTLGYVAAGARSYAQAVLTRAISLSQDPGWSLNFEQEIQRLDRELHEMDYREVDHYWREFLASGRHHREVRRACAEADCPLLAERVEQIRVWHQARPGT